MMVLKTIQYFSQCINTFKKIGDTDHISEWKSKGLSDKSTSPPAASSNSLAPSLSYISSKTRVKSVGSCLKQDKVTLTQ